MAANVSLSSDLNSQLPIGSGNNFSHGDTFSANIFPDMNIFRCELENCLWVDWNNTLENRKVTFLRQSGLRIFVKCMNQYGIPVMITIGCILNLTTFCVFISNSTYMKKSTSVYVSALAIANKGYLFALFIIWLEHKEVRIFHRSGWCQLVIFTTHLSSFLSTWAIVCLSYERFLVITHQKQWELFCTRKKSKKVLLGLILFSLIAYSYVLWTTGILYLGGIPLCAPLSRHFTMLRVMGGFDTIWAIVIPTCLIIYFNIRAFKFTIEQKRNSSFRSLETQTTEVDNKSTMEDIETGSSDNQQRIDLTLTNSNTSPLVHMELANGIQTRVHSCDIDLPVGTLAMTYVIFNLPSHIMKIYIYLEKFTGKRHLPLTSASIQEIFQFLYYVNFSVMFLVIFIRSALFRKALLSMLAGAVERLNSILRS